MSTEAERGVLWICNSVRKAESQISRESASSIIQIRGLSVLSVGSGLREIISERGSMGDRPNSSRK